MINVLFVCLGNICRSPMAEGLMKKYIEEEGLSGVIHDESRGTSAYEIGQPPHPETMKILKREQAPLIGKRAEQIKSSDFIHFDFIIGMDHTNVRQLISKSGAYRHKVYLLRDIDPTTHGEEVPDPYYSGRYEETYQLLAPSLKQWLEHLKKT